MHVSLIVFLSVAIATGVMFAAGWWSPKVERLFGALLVTGVILSLFTGMIAGIVALQRIQCDRISKQVQRETQFYAIGGCFVTLKDGRSVPIDENSIGLFLED